LLISDNLHHNDRGYACIAEALFAALVAGLPALQTAVPAALTSATQP
jgi:hypothetical protein